MTVRGWGKVERTIGLDSFRVNILCESHNNRLSEVDAEGIALSRKLKKAQEILSSPTIRNQPVQFNVDGPRLERWFLKTFINLCIRDCRNWTWEDGRPVDDPPPTLVRAAFGLDELRHPMGLYDINIAGRQSPMEDTVGLLTVADRESVILGGRFDFHILLYGMWVSDVPFPTPGENSLMFDRRTEGVTVTHHNPAGLWYTQPVASHAGATAACEFLIHWPEDADGPPLAAPAK